MPLWFKAIFSSLETGGIRMVHRVD
jgi:hypothetical protein